MKQHLSRFQFITFGAIKTAYADALSVQISPLRP